MSESIPGPEIGYTDLIDYCLNNKEEKYTYFPLRPSSAGRCSRALTFELSEYLKKGGPYPKTAKEPHVKRLLSLGHSVEWHSIKNFELVAENADNLSIRFKQQSLPIFRLPPYGDEKRGRLVEGSLDLAVMNKNGGGGFGDVKSAKDKYSSYFKTYWAELTDKLNSLSSLKSLSSTAWYAPDLKAFLAELDDPFFEDNFRQLNIYCCTEFAKEHDIDHGFIYRYNKNTSEHLEIRFAPSPEVAKEFQDKMTKVYTCVMSGEAIPERCDWAVGSMKYAFCDCHTYAGEDPKEALQSWFNTFPKKTWPDKASSVKGISALMKQYQELEEASEKKVKLEQDICKQLSDKKINKIKLDDGQVWEVKPYKTGGVAGGPRLALKRTKL